MVDGQFQIVLGVRLLMVTMVISDLYLMVVGDRLLMLTMVVGDHLLMVTINQ